MKCLLENVNPVDHSEQGKGWEVPQSHALEALSLTLLGETIPKLGGGQRLPTSGLDPGNLINSKSCACFSVLGGGDGWVEPQPRMGV